METLFDQRTIDKIRQGISARQETLAVAESVTAGLLQAAFASAIEASGFFQGGITAYNLGQKSRHLIIEPIHAVSCNCVSAKVAKEMALNVCPLFNSNWGIGITGYASPVPESDNKVFCYFAIAYRGHIIAEDKIDATETEPLKVQLEYVKKVTDRVCEEVAGK